MNRFANALIGPATADISVHGVADFLIRRMRLLRQQRRCLHNLPHLAIPALRHFLVNPSLLQRMQSVRSASTPAKTLNCRDLLAHRLRNLRLARTPRRAVDQHRASAAQPRAAPELGTRHGQRVAQNPEQRRFGCDGYIAVTAVYAQCEIGHGVSSSGSLRLSNMSGRRDGRKGPQKRSRSIRAGRRNSALRAGSADGLSRALTHVHPREV